MIDDWDVVRQPSFCIPRYRLDRAEMTLVGPISAKDALLTGDARSSNPAWVIFNVIARREADYGRIVRAAFPCAEFSANGRSVFVRAEDFALIMLAAE